MNRESVTGTEKREENWREDRRAFKKFLLVILVCGIIGGIAGMAVVAMEGIYVRVAGALRMAIHAAAPFGNVIVTTVVLILLASLMGRSRKLQGGWDGEDEQVAEQIERKLSYGMMLTSVHMLLSLFFFMIGIYGGDYERPYEIIIAGRILLAFVGLFYATIVNTLFQKALVNFTKEMNPEKRGSVYDIKFQKTWFESCDELERMQMGQASYKAFQTTTYTCIGLSFFCFLGMMAWDFGLLPLTMVVVIQMVMSLSYQWACICQTKKTNL